MCESDSHHFMPHILSVDDSATMRQMVAFALKEAGFEVTQAWNGVEALEKANAASYSLVLTDVHMPQMDGLTLIQELRKLETYRFTPILMLTTESSVEKKQEGKAAGATGWIVKPFDPEQLVRTIRKVLG
jgi:two-component system chemotaxis response regulator CheY